MKKFLVLIAIIVISASCRKQLITPPVPKPVEEVCYPGVTVGGVLYTVSPCIINTTMKDGGGDQFVDIVITPSKNILYGFSVHGYGVGFPDYGILPDASSGGAMGPVNIKLRLNDKYLGPGSYKGHLPILIFHGSATGDDTTFLKVKINVQVK